MATIAFAALAANAGVAAGSAGMVAITTAGMVIDQMFMPYIFRRDPIESARIGDIQMIGVEEGTPGIKAVGATVRVPGRLIWRDTPREVRESNSVGKGSTIVNYKYFMSCAVEILQTEIDEVLKVWADGQQIYDNETAATDFTSNQFLLNWPLIGSELPSNRIYLMIPTAVFDLSELGIGPRHEITISGASAGANNGTFEILAVGLYSTYSYALLERTSGSFVNEAAGANIRIEQDALLWFPGVQRSGNPTIYKGTATQNPDAHMESKLGVGQVPAYRGIAYVRFNQMALTSYGNRVPNLEFLVKVKNATTLQGAVNRLFDDAGLPSGTYVDVSALSGNVGGYSVQGTQELSRVIQPLMVAYDLSARNRAGKLVLFPRESPDLYEVDPGDLAAVVADEGSESMPRPVSLELFSPIERPGEVFVTHVNPDNDYHVGEQRAGIATNKDAVKMRLNLPLTMSADDARTIANRVLHHSVSNDKTVDLLLPPSYSDLEEGDVLTFDLDGVDYELEAFDVVRGRNSIVLVKAQIRLTRGVDFTLAAS